MENRNSLVVIKEKIFSKKIETLPDREVNPSDYLGSIVEIVHLRNRAITKDMIGVREKKVRTIIKILEDAGVTVKDVGPLLELPNDKTKRFIGGALADECVVKRAKFLAKKGINVIVDNALTIKNYGD